MQTTTLLKRLAAALLLLAITLQFATALGQGPVFTYQGRLNDGANAATGNFDLTFTLYNASSGGVSLAGPVTNSAVAVTNGLFTTTIDFGAGIFTGGSNWLGIGVRTSGSGAFAALTPRQQMTPTPYAIFAEGANAAGLSGSLPGASLSGTYNGAVTLNNAGNSFTGNGSGLTSLNAGSLSSGTVADARLSANIARLNAYQTFTGQNNFNGGSVGIGTSTPFDALLDVEGDIRLNQHNLYLREGNDRNHGLGWYGVTKLFGTVNVDGPVLFGCDGGGLGSGCTTNLALRWRSDGNVMIDPTGLNDGSLLPGLTFGIDSGEGIASKRTLGDNLFGLDFFTSFQRRLSLDNSGNLYAQGVVDTLGSTTMEFRVRGTRALRLDQGVATNGSPNLIGGSVTNWVDAAAYGSTIAGGGATNWGGSAYPNRIVGTFGTIGGGMDNSISNNAGYATIAGGYHHSIQSATGGSIGGGYANSIKTGASYGTIGGGNINVIQTSASYATVAGGSRNTVANDSTYSAIGGGSYNAISNVSYAVIPGGYRAAATHYGQFAFASGDFAAPGDAQTSMYVLRGQFSGSAYSSLYLDNSFQMLTIPNGGVWGFEIMAVGALKGGPSAVFKFTGAIRNYGGAVAFIGTPTKTLVAADGGASTWDVVIGANYGALDIQAKGTSASYVSWVATVRTTEVTPNN